ncbi:MAG: FAD-dependent oxidoreductase [Firmicutes bacterium]|nr:FAD-dependent oxidoreductase [Bacillota bacterium]
MPQRTITTDVAVFGSGPAGIGAALAAARNGAKTLLVEKMGFLGGQMTAGLVTGLHGYRIHKGSTGKGSGAYLAVNYDTEQVLGGIPKEIVDRLVERGGAYCEKKEPSMRVEFDPEVMTSLLFDLMEEAGVTLLLNAFAFGCTVDQGYVKAVRVASKSGEELIEAKQYVDATADGDIAAWSGAPFEMGRSEDGRTMPISLYMLLAHVDLKKTIDYLKEHPSELHTGTPEGWESLYLKGAPIDLGGFRELIFKAYQNGDYPLPLGATRGYPNPIFFITTSTLPRGYTKLLIDMAYGVDITDSLELSKAEAYVRRVQIPGIMNFVRKYMPGFENSLLLQTAPLIGTRESRRIKGDYMLTEEDVLNNRRFPTVVARCGRAMNVHSPVGGGKEEERGGQKWIEPKDPKGFDIPFECLVPQKVNNLLVSGRCISVTHMALGSVRGEPVCMATGEAAGTAAALCATKGINSRELPIDTLQSVLRRNGVKLD